MTQTFFTEDHRVYQDLLSEIFAGMFLVRAIRIVSNIACDISTAEIGRQIASRVGAADLHVRKSVECAIENQPRQKECRLERISYDIAKITSSPQRTVFDDIVG